MNGVAHMDRTILSVPAEDGELAFEVTDRELIRNERRRRRIERWTRCRFSRTRSSGR